MKKYRREIFIIALFVLACVVLVLFDYFSAFSADETLNLLLKETVSRFAVFFILIPAAVLCGCKKSFGIKIKAHDILWCLPCFLVAVCNFPFSSLIRGTASVTRTELIWLFALDCVSIGLLEELLFRGILQPMLFDVFQKKGVIVAILVNSALFGVWHLANLFGGAGILPTLMQVGYSFLFGAMLSAVFLRTGNIWGCVFLHALFDFGGLLTDRLGAGDCQDLVFWILTAVSAVLCFCHVLIYLLRYDKNKRAARLREEEIPQK